MNYAQLKDAISLYAENFETGFLDSVDGFIRAAEQRIYNLAKLPASNQNQTAQLTPGNRYLTLPSGFLSVNEVEVVSATGRTQFLLNKETSFLREAYPSAADQGIPQYYAMFDENTLLLAPTPDDEYPVELHFFGYPESIVTAGSTWLGDNYDQTLLYGALMEAAVFMKAEMDMQMYFERFASAMSLLGVQVDVKNNRDWYRKGRTEKGDE